MIAALILPGDASVYVDSAGSLWVVVEFSGPSGSLTVQMTHKQASVLRERLPLTSRKLDEFDNEDRDHPAPDAEDGADEEEQDEERTTITAAAWDKQERDNTRMR